MNIKIQIPAEDLKKKLNLKDGEPGAPGKDSTIPGPPGKDSFVPGPPGEPGKNGSPDKPIQVRDKLETLDGDERLDKKAIKGLEYIIDQPILDRAIGILDQRTSFLINKVSALEARPSGTGGDLSGTYLKLDQTTPQTTVGAFRFPSLGINKAATSNIGIDLLNVAGGQGVRIQNTGANEISYSAYVTGDSFTRFSVLASGGMQWGSGALVYDTNLYRSSANTLATDGFIIATGFQSPEAGGSIWAYTPGTNSWGASGANIAMVDGHITGDFGDIDFSSGSTRMVSITLGGGSNPTLTESGGLLGVSGGISTEQIFFPSGTQLTAGSGVLQWAGTDMTIGGTLVVQQGDNVSTLFNDSGYLTSISGGDHNTLSNLTVGDVHTQYVFKTGRAGGQTIIGGTATTDDLILQTTSANGATGAVMIFKGGNNGGTEFARFLNSGNFGVGTASPASKLHIENDGGALSATFRSFSSTASFGVQFIASRGRGTAASISAVQNGDFLGGFNFQGVDTDPKLITSATIRATVDATPTTDEIPSKIVFSTTTPGSGAGTSEKMVLKSNGYLGLNTTAPDKLFEINLGTAEAFRLTYNDANGSAATYMDTTVSSVGLTTFTAAGSAPTFAFAQDVAVTGDVKATTYHVGTDAGIDATVTYVDTVLGAKVLTFKKGILTAQT